MATELGNILESTLEPEPEPERRTESEMEPEPELEPKPEPEHNREIEIETRRRKRERAMERRQQAMDAIGFKTGGLATIQKQPVSFSLRKVSSA